MFRKILLSMVVFGTVASSARSDLPITREKIVEGLSIPVMVTSPPNDIERLFIVELNGHNGVAGMAAVRIYNTQTKTLLDEPFFTLEVRPTNQIESDRGLLCMAFSPSYSQNGEFFIYYNRPEDGRQILAKGHVSNDDPNKASSGFESLIELYKPPSPHAGGWLGFSPKDGYLYFTSGDSAGGFMNPDQFDFAQSLDSWWGKLLRIDGSGRIPDSNPFSDSPIWARGLRNCWRCSFDRLTGDLYIADVGEFRKEEINVQPADSKGGENYGWNCYEGDEITEYCSFNPPSSIQPGFSYGPDTGRSIIGGYVYRGCAIPSLYGRYVFGDFMSKKFWTLKESAGQLVDLMEHPSLAQDGSSPVSFGEDARGELYVCDRQGSIFRIVATDSSESPCEPTLSGPNENACAAGIPAVLMFLPVYFFFLRGRHRTN